MSFLTLIFLAGLAAPSRDAGKVARVIPRVDVFHGGRAKEHLYQDAAVSENDRIHTEPGGRARIVLGDGSILNIGSASEMTIKSVATSASGPAAVELAYGKIRAEISKRASGGTAFEVRTSTAICGVLGTTLFIDNTKKYSHVINISPPDSGSQVKVRSSNRKIAQEVTLNPGQGTLVYKGKAPTPPHVMGQPDRDQARLDTDVN